jgi:environmental stress-induced protein Ves
MTVWLEPSDGDSDPQWRWRVSHAQTGEEAHFTRLADVLSFISAQSGSRPPQ